MLKEFSAVNVITLPAPTILSGGGTSCDGGLVTLTASTYTGVTSYIWTGSVSGVQAGTGQNLDVNTAEDFTVKNVAGTCTGAASTPVTVATHSTTTPTISTPDGLSYCNRGGSPLTLSAPSSSGYLWSTGATTQSITTTDGGGYWVKVFDGTCTSVQSPVVTVVISFCWVGLNSDWTDHSNWGTPNPGDIPTSTDNAFIVSGTNPVISGDQNVAKLTINSGTNLNINDGASLTLWGNGDNPGDLVVNGTINNSPAQLTGTISMAGDGNGAQTISGNGFNVGTLIIYNTDGVTQSTGTDNIGIQKVLLLEKGTFTVGTRTNGYGFITLLSNSSGTGIIDDFTYAPYAGALNSDGLVSEQIWGNGSALQLEIGSCMNTGSGISNLGSPVVYGPLVSDLYTSGGACNLIKAFTEDNHVWAVLPNNGACNNTQLNWATIMHPI